MEGFDLSVKQIFKNYFYEKDVEHVLEKIRLYPKFVIFGAGQLGHKVYNILEETGAKAISFCDNKLCGKMDDSTGLEIVELIRLEEKEKTFILIAVFDEMVYDIVYRQLLDFGFKKEQLMDGRNMTKRNALSCLKQNIEKYRKAYSLLADDFSREVYVNVMKKTYLDVDISHVVNNAKDTYFDKAVVLAKDEVFVDCGGYKGETTIEFIKRTNGQYKKLIIFEPEKCKETVIRENLKGYDYELYMCGAWNRSTVLKFSASGDSASHIAESGEIEISVKALDDVILEDCPTFIKMDIEGAEVEALKGSRKIITEYKPKLAICIYHKPEHLFEIPLLIKEMRDDYQLVIRQYSNSRFETVCYAV